MPRFVIALLASLAAIILHAPFAGALDRPTGEPILIVSGEISQTNEDGKAVFDLEMLDRLASRDTTTETPWTEGKKTFSGPLLRAVLEACGAKGARLIVKALNDYSAEVPVSDATDFETILASRIDGQELSVRDKGPLFLIYPFDSHSELYNEKYFNRSVWQIHQIEVTN